VWAGWGHASENPKLPELLHKHGIAFIGKGSRSLIWPSVHVSYIVTSLVIENLFSQVPQVRLCGLLETRLPPQSWLRQLVFQLCPGVEQVAWSYCSHFAFFPVLQQSILIEFCHFVKLFACVVPPNDIFASFFASIWCVGSYFLDFRWEGNFIDIIWLFFFFFLISQFSCRLDSWVVGKQPEEESHQCS